MKVYVCYYAYDFEGCSDPQRVFTKREDAESWQEKHKHQADDVGYVELDIE